MERIGTGQLGNKAGEEGSGCAAQNSLGVRKFALCCLLNATKQPPRDAPEFRSPFGNGGEGMEEVIRIKTYSHLVQNTPACANFRNRGQREGKEPLGQHLLVLCCWGLGIPIKGSKRVLWLEKKRPENKTVYLQSQGPSLLKLKVCSLEERRRIKANPAKRESNYLIRDWLFG